MNKWYGFCCYHRVCVIATQSSYKISTVSSWRTMFVQSQCCESSVSKYDIIFTRFCVQFTRQSARFHQTASKALNEERQREREKKLYRGNWKLTFNKHPFHYNYDALLQYVINKTIEGTRKIKGKKQTREEVREATYSGVFHTMATIYFCWKKTCCAQSVLLDYLQKCCVFWKPSEMIIKSWDLFLENLKKWIRTMISFEKMFPFLMAFRLIIKKQLRLNVRLQLNQSMPFISYKH